VIQRGILRAYPQSMNDRTSGDERLVLLRLSRERGKRCEIIAVPSNECL
jgi:hypothetical protein